MTGSRHDEMVTALRAFAARRTEPFRPQEALAELTGPESRIEKARVLTALQADCAVTTTDEGGALWSLRPTARHRFFTNSAIDESDGASMVERALGGLEPFTPERLDEIVAGHNAPGASLDEIVVALDDAGPGAPGHHRLFALRALLNRRRAEERARTRLEAFVGREDELERLATWIADADPLGAPTSSLHVSGIPGVGKSFLLEKAIFDAGHDARPIVLTLDFDRVGIDVLDAQGLFDELSRQFADACPEAASDLRELRLESVGQATRMRDLKASAHPASMGVLRAMAEITRASGRPVLLVGDTMEVLRSRGETHVMRFFENCDQLAKAGIHPLRIVTAGRGDALAPARERVAEESIRLTGLTEGEANEMAESLEVPASARPSVWKLARGNPLLIRMAATAIGSRGFDIAKVPAKAKAEIVQGYLYRAILSRLPRPVNRLAKVALALRNVSEELTRNVLAPALGLEMTAHEVRQDFESLASQQWLLEPEKGTEGLYRRRADTWTAILPMLAAEADAETAEVHRRAAAFFETRDPAMALYHRLHLTRWGEPMPEIGRDEAERIGDVLPGELPPAARDALLQARGKRSDFVRVGAPESGPPTPPVVVGFRGPAEPAADGTVFAVVGPTRSLRRLRRNEGPGRSHEPDERAVHDLEMLLERDDVREAGFVLEHGYSGTFAASSRAGRAALCYFWLAGRWAAARALLGPLSREDLREALEDRPVLEGRVLLEAMAEFRTARLAAILGDDGIAELALSCHHKSTRIGLAGGLLDFLLLGAVRARGESSRPSLELADGLSSVADNAWTERINYVLRTVEDARLRVGLHLPPGAGERALLRRMRDIAALNPYAEPIEACASEEAEREARDYARGLASRPRTLARLFLHVAADWPGGGAESDEGLYSADEAMALLAALGLTSDWSAAFARSRASADLRLLARAAENWRALVFGSWHYGGEPVSGVRAPRGRLPDAMCVEQLDALLDEPDPARSARAQLAFWKDPGQRSDDEAPAVPSLAGRVEAARRRRAAMAGLEHLVADRRLAAGLAVPRAVADGGWGSAKRSPQIRRDHTMTDGNESIGRLEALAAKGAYDTVRKALDRGNPVLDELRALGGVSREKIAAALDVAPPHLEAAGMAPSFLEAIVLASGRPPLIVANGKVEGKETLRGLDDFPEDIDVQIAQVERFLPSVGRVEFLNHDMSWGGTGWLVGRVPNGERLMVTNRHVARIVAQRRRDGSGVFLPSLSGLRYGAELDLGEESGIPSRPEQLLPIERFTYIADDISADVALARVTVSEEVWAGLDPLDPDEEDGEDGDLVAVVGYPAADGFRNDRTEMERYFRGLYDVKRFAPGLLRARPGVSVFGHDCTTLGGNSGSPIISLSRKAVVGLHYAGEYGVGNSAVRISTLRGVLAGTGGGVAGAGGPSAPTEAPDGEHGRAFFEGRSGYDPEFLQVVSVPLPMPSGPALDDLARPDDATTERPHELRYQHFGVLYSTERKGPLITAHNVDGARYRPIKRGGDVWFHDLRIPRDIQLDQTSYGDAAIDRGHMVRRADTNWGDSDEEARRADVDSFHYTNASPQHAGLNRSRDLWLGLEDYLLGNVRTHGFRACVFTGPVYTQHDPEFDGIVLPLSFWKVVAMLASDASAALRLHATAYVLSQGQIVQDLLTQRGVTEAAEGFAFSSFKTFQVRVADVAGLSGLDFGPLSAADPLARLGGEEGTMPGAKPIVQIEELTQIVV